MHLYEIATDIEGILATNDGELAEEACAALDKLEMDFTEKAENVAKYIRGIEADAKAFADEAKRLAEKATARKNKVVGLKRYLQQCMNGLGILTVNGKLLKISIQKNAPSVEIINEGVIPKQYWIDGDPRLDKKALLAALKTDDKPQGVMLKQTESIRIR